MKPEVFKAYPVYWQLRSGKDWTVRFRDKTTGKIRVIFADTWREAISLVEHGYREGYFAL